MSENTTLSTSPAPLPPHHLHQARLAGRISVDEYVDHLQATGRFLTPEEAASAAADTACPQWRAETPLIAEAGVAMMGAASDKDPAVFAGLPFTPGQLQAELWRIQDLQRARDEAEAEFRRLCRALSYRQ